MSGKARTIGKSPKARATAPDPPPDSAPDPADPNLTTTLPAGKPAASASSQKPADQPVKLKNVWTKGHAEKCRVNGKDGWKCPWCKNIFYPVHATRAILHWMRGEICFFLLFLINLWIEVGDGFGRRQIAAGAVKAVTTTALAGRLRPSRQRTHRRLL